LAIAGIGNRCVQRGAIVSANAACRCRPDKVRAPGKLANFVSITQPEGMSRAAG
jgi:hypothetical protein